MHWKKNEFVMYEEGMEKLDVMGQLKALDLLGYEKSVMLC